MWYSVFKFELWYRSKRIETYLFFIIILLCSLVAVDFIYGGVDLGKIQPNAPVVIAKTMALVTGVSMVLVSMIMGVPVLRDFQYAVQPLIFVNPIKKWHYLLGRFAGSFVLVLFLFSGMVLGLILGNFMPWHDSTQLLPFALGHYLFPFLTISLPTLFFGSAIFFVSGTLSKKLIVVYSQGIFFFVAFILNRNISDPFIAGVLDPFSFDTIGTLTQYWTPLECNTAVVPLNGMLLWNRTFWTLIGMAVLLFGYKKFSFSTPNSPTKKSSTKTYPTQLKQKQNAATAATENSLQTSPIVQLLAHGLFYFKSILKENSFWAIVIGGMAIISINSISLGTVYGVNSLPLTYLIVQELQEMSRFFFVILLVFYSGEIIWMERGVKINAITDSTPISNTSNLAGKFIGLLLVYTLLLLFLICGGLLFQTVKGYYHFQLGNYLGGFFIEIFPFLLLYSFISFFIHVVVNSRILGHVVVLMFFVLMMALELWGWDHWLFKYGGNNIGVYSEMNGYGHFLAPYLWVKLYWLVFGLLLMGIAAVAVVRGSDLSLKNRWILAKSRMSLHWKLSMVILGILLTTIGSFLWYNSNILNEWWSHNAQKQYRVQYEKTLQEFEYLPQAKITSVFINIELYPHNRSYHIEGTYILVNPHKEALHEIHVQKLLDNHVDLSSVELERQNVVRSQHDKFGYYIYQLTSPLQPGDSLKMKFIQTYTSKGIDPNENSTSVVANGTFINNQSLPTLGYNRKYELSNTKDRAEFGLPLRVEKAKKEDPNELKNARTGSDGDAIDFEIIIGTQAGQTAVAPGRLKNKWTSGARDYFHYKMTQPIINFYSIVSAHYKILRDQWIAHDKADPVDLEIYYHPGHEQNLERMVQSMQASLGYCSENFSPYPYQQLRIMEFPRYANFAQSFPNTVPFSESMGFVLDIKDSEDVDMAFYVTAHEIAHQWWGNQLAAANVQGQLMVIESLAQYTAIMVLQAHFSEEKVRQFLAIQHDSYFKNRVKTSKPELPLYQVEGQKFLYYQKGAINMYAFQDIISEDSVNKALSKFIQDWNILDGKLRSERYPTTDDLLSYFRAVTPANQLYLIQDLFETITFYDNSITQATLLPLPGGKYQVEATLQVRKYRMDGNGAFIYDDQLEAGPEDLNKTLPIADFIELGFFDKKNKPIYLQKHHITRSKNKIKIVLNQKPNTIGIDPFHKLLERNKEDNIRPME